MGYGKTNRALVMRGFKLHQTQSKQSVIHEHVQRGPEQWLALTSVGGDIRGPPHNKEREGQSSRLDQKLTAG